ncbi:hypothetical protein J3E69DRAFT_326019 [Trichoderma sp. SZMC 28015]
MLHSLSLARHQQSYRTRTGSSTACPSMKDCMYMLPLGMPVPVHTRGHPLKIPHPLSPQQKLSLFLGKEEKNNSIKSDIFCFSCRCRPCPPRLLQPIPLPQRCSLIQSSRRCTYTANPSYH